MTPDLDIEFIRQAISIAHKAEADGNLPVGSLITLDDRVVSQGPSRVYQPDYDLTRHAEMEAIRALPHQLWDRVADMTLYTTLEPCPMCLGGILLNSIPRVVYGAAYPPGGSLSLAEHLPGFFKERFIEVEWVGPLLPAECDPLLRRLLEIEEAKAD
jgi:tRNA(adenine34) deaminase